MKLASVRDSKKIRYIKLGDGGKWWKECLDRKIIRLGFNSGSPEVFDLAKSGDWESLKKYFADRQVGTPTQHTNQTQEFFEDNGETLWITFEDGCLYYAFSDGGGIVKEPSIENKHCTSYRRLAGDGWKNTDAEGNELRRESLSGRLTKTAGYRQTICGLKKDVEEYLRNRLECKVSSDLVKAISSKSELVRFPR